MISFDLNESIETNFLSFFINGPIPNEFTKLASFSNNHNAFVDAISNDLNLALAETADPEVAVNTNSNSYNYNNINILLRTISSSKKNRISTVFSDF